MHTNGPFCCVGVNITEDWIRKGGKGGKGKGKETWESLKAGLGREQSDEFFVTAVRASPAVSGAMMTSF